MGHGIRLTVESMPTADHKSALTELGDSPVSASGEKREVQSERSCCELKQLYEDLSRLTVLCDNAA